MSWWRGLVPVRFAPDGEVRSRPGVTVAGGPRGLQVQRDESDDGRHSLGSCCPEDLPVWCRPPSGELTHAPADPRALFRAIQRSTSHPSRAAPGSPKVGSRMDARGKEGGGAVQEERAREQPRGDRQVWSQGFFGGHECWRRRLGCSELASLRPRYIWESVAGGSFTVQKVTEMVHGGVKRDTEITFYWKEDLSEFSEERRLEGSGDDSFLNSSASPSVCMWRI